MVCESYSRKHALRIPLIFAALLFCLSLGAFAQSGAVLVDPRASALFSVPATHVLGFENTKPNCNGELSIQNGALRFEHGGNSGAQINLASVRGVFVGAESKQVGGVPLKVGEAAVPFGGGRVVSLFAHKKLDTVTVEFVDADGGFHGAIFQVAKGQGELVRSELAARGVPSPTSDEPTKASTAEASHGSK